MAEQSGKSVTGTRRLCRLPLRQVPLLALPRFLSGFRLGDWLRLLRSHRFAVDPVFWPRAALATAGAAVTSSLTGYDTRMAARAVDTKAWEQPIFILGLPRSGTTHLFELLSQSPDLCYPTRFDAFNPHTFLLLRRIGLFGALARLPTFKRAMDNVRVGWDSPEEDIVALSILTLKGERLERVFPRDRGYAANAAKDRVAHQGEAMELIRALRRFTRKLVFLHGKRVLLKTPRHMGRLQEIVAEFPQAKFVVIYRNPIHQLASVMAMEESGNPWWCALQRPEARSHEGIMNSLEDLLRRFFEARALVSSENLVEITFEQLVADRVGVINRICQQFSLAAPPTTNACVAANRKGRQPRAVPDAWIPLVYKHYKLLFEAGVYPWPP